MLGNSGRLSGMKNIFKKKPNNNRCEMEFADYALAVFVGLLVIEILYCITELFL